jgi:hypothetical protein
VRAAPLVVLPFLLGCPPNGDKAGVDTAPVPPLVAWGEAWGQAPWDPVAIGRSDAAVATPNVHDEAGTQERYVPLRDREGAQVVHDEGATVWVPATELTPGAYTMSPPHGVDVWDGSGGFEVLPYGVSDAFDAANVVGRTYRLLGAHVVEPAGVTALATSLSEGVHFQILSVEGESARFRIVYDDGADRACDFLRATGTLTSTGRFSWSEPGIEAPTVPNPMHLENLSIELGFLADGTAIGGARGTGTADVRDLLDEEGDRVVCDLLTTLGTSCWDCVGDDAPTCATVAFHAGTLQPIDGSYADDLPSCGLDLDDAGEALSCTWDGDICAFSALVPFLTLAAARRRKRT